LKEIFTLLVILTLLTPTLAVTIPQVKAQEATIETSSNTFNKYGVIEIRINTPTTWTYKNLTLRVLDANFNPFSVKDYTDKEIDYTDKKFVAWQMAAGIYIAYLGGSATSYTQVKYPKVTLDYEAGPDNKVNFAKLPVITVDEKSFYIECLEAGVTKLVDYKNVTLTVATDRAAYPLNATLKLIITDPDYNGDPTSIDRTATTWFYLNYTKVTRTATGQAWELTWQATGNSTTLDKVFGYPTSKYFTINETAPNSGVFKSVGLSLDKLAEYLRWKDGWEGFWSWRPGDIVTLKISNDTRTTAWDRNDVATVTFEVKSVTPSVSAVASFSDEVRVTLDWFDANSESWAKNTVNVNVSLKAGDYHKQIATGRNYLLLTETDYDTSVFTNATKPDLDWDPTLLNLAGNGTALKLLVNKTTYARTYFQYFKDIALTDPEITFGKPGGYYLNETMKVYIKDPDLNDKAGVTEVYRASGVIGDVRNIWFTSPAGYPRYVKLTITNLNTGQPLKLTRAQDLVLNEVEPGKFELKIDLNYVDATEGVTLRFEVLDQTSGAKVPSDIPILARVRTISLDRDVYPVPVDDKSVCIITTLNAPDLNKDPNVREKITRTDGYVKWKITNYDGSVVIGPHNLELLETDVNTGVFKAANNSLHSGIVSPKLIGGKVTVWFDADRDWTLDTDEIRAEASFRVTTAAISVTPTQFTFGDEVTISILEPDANTNSTTKESLTAKVLFTNIDGESKTIDLSGTYALKETDVNTGTFTIKLKVGLTYGTPAVEFKPKPASTVTIRYVERTPSWITPDMTDWAPTTNYVEYSAKMKSHSAVFTIDKDKYGPTAKVKITIEDFDKNTDLAVKNNVSAYMSVGLTPATYNNVTETDVNTGVFKLTTPKLTTAFGVSAASLIGKTLAVSYTDEVNAAGATEVLVKYASIVSEDGALSFDKPNYDVGETAKITVVDLDANLDPDVVNTVKVTITSTSDPVGVAITLAETDVNTGVFEGTVKIATTTGLGQIYAKVGDTLTAKYKDEYPADYATTEKSKVFSKTATVGVVVLPIPMEAAKPSMVSPVTGATITTGKVGERVYLSTTVTNKVVVSKDFEALIQVKDEAGVVVYIGTVGGTIAGGQTLNVRTTWTPPAAGTYTVEVLVWKSLAEPEALSEKVTTTITVTE